MAEGTQVTVFLLEVMIMVHFKLQEILVDGFLHLQGRMIVPETEVHNQKDYAHTDHDIDGKDKAVSAL